MLIPRGTVIFLPETSNIHPQARIGEDCKIHSHVFIGRDVEIGDRCKIQAFAYIPSLVTLEQEVFIGPRVTFTNDKHPPSGGRHWDETRVERGAVIGAGAIILPGLTIGHHAVVGAGAVVTKSVLPYTTVIGNPARRIDAQEK